MRKPKVPNIKHAIAWKKDAHRVAAKQNTVNAIQTKPANYSFTNTNKKEA